MPRDHGDGCHARFAPAVATIAGSSAARRSLMGCDVYRATFGADPVGFWLPECAYAPGLERYCRRQPALVHCRRARFDVRRTAPATRDLCAMPIPRRGRQRSRGTAIRAGRSGARRKVIRAIRPTVIFIATSGFDLPLEYLRPGTATAALASLPG